MYIVTINMGYALKQVSLDLAKFQPMTLGLSMWEANALPSELPCWEYIHYLFKILDQLSFTEKLHKYIFSK